MVLGLASPIEHTKYPSDHNVFSFQKYCLNILPYTPSIGKYKIYREDFLVDKNNGDFDTLGYFYMITPDNNRIELNKFRTQVNGKWVDISKKEYDELKKKKIN